MENKTRNSSTTSNKTAKTPRTPARNYTAQEKAQAVLAVWTERCKPAEVCRQMKINWITFSQWQARAMEGMLQALEPGINLAQGAALSPRLQTLLLKRQRELSTQKLSTRLEQIALAKTPVESPKTP